MMTKPLFLLGECYGENEARINRPFVGASGIELLRMLNEAHIIEFTSADTDYIRRFWDAGDPALLDCVWNLHPEVYRSNVFMSRPPGNRLEWFCGPKTTAIHGYPALIKGKYVRAEFAFELERLADELVGVNPNLIVCLGNSALWALAGKTGISKLRGTTCLSTHLATDFKLLPTYHPAAVLRQWELRPITVMDLCKAERERKFPEIRRLAREIWVEPTLEDLEEFYVRYIVGCKILSVDIETSGSQITCIGFAPRRDIALVIPFYDARGKGRSYWPDSSSERKCWEFILRILVDGSIHKLFQNGLYDISFLYRAYGIKVLGATHDTMLLHHSLQPESLKGLGFLGSIYCDEGAWKADHRMGTIKRDD